VTAAELRSGPRRATQTKRERTLLRVGVTPAPAEAARGRDHKPAYCQRRCQADTSLRRWCTALRGGQDAMMSLHRPHALPVAPAALELSESRSRGDDAVFSSQPIRLVAYEPR
jgi:hypothetical protein